MEKWEVQVFNAKECIWELEVRYYYHPKYVTDFDLHDVENKRRCAIKIETT